MINLYIFNELSNAAVYGIGTYIRELTEALKSSQMNVTVVHLRSDKQDMEIEELDGIPHWYIPWHMNRNTLLGWQRQFELYYRNVVYLLQLQIKNKNRIIFHLNYSKSGKLADELKKTFECKIVTVVHYSDWGLLINDNLPRLRSLLQKKQSNSFEEAVIKRFEEEKSLYVLSDQIICLSNYMHAILCKDYGINSTKISFIPNWMLTMDNIETDNYPSLRKKWQIPKKEKIILFAGRIDEIKGVSYLIKAFRKVLDEFPNCRLILAGNGKYDMFIQEAKAICTKITFSGLLDRKDLYELYQIANIGVVPSLYEPFGYVAVEMMMHGLPIVASATSGLNEVVDDSCGLKVPIIEYPDRVEIDPDLLAERIIYLLQHPTKAKQMGQNGRKRYLNKYTSEIFRQNMMKLYESLYQ